MKKIFASDTAFQIYSVLIAILLWVFVVYNQNPQSTKVVDDIAIAYTNAAELERNNLIILKKDKEPTVAITVKGRRLSIGKIEASNVSAFATIPSIREGEYDVSVETRLPISDVSIIDKNPYTIKVSVEKIMRKKVPVEIKYTGNPKKDNVSVQATVSPQEVTVWGPQSVIQNVASALVTYDVSNIGEGNSFTTTYKVISSDGKDITNNPNVNIDSDVVSIIPSVYNTKEVAIEASLVGTMPSGCAISEVSILPEKILLGSKGDEINSIEKIITEPIDISNLTQDTKIAASLIVPDDVVNIYSVSEVDVSIKVTKSVTKAVSIESITFKNADETKIYETYGLPVSVTFHGAKAQLDSLNPNALVNVDGLTNGTHTLPIEFDLHDAIRVDGDYFVDVSVSDVGALQ